MNPAVEGYAAAVLGGPEAGDKAALAQELAAVARLVADNVDLHGALTDTSIAGPARRAVVQDLLEGRVSKTASRLAGYAAGAVHAQEVPSALGWLAHRAHQEAEGLEPHAASLPHTEARRRVGGFAAALFEDVSVDELSEIEDELFRFARIVDSTPQLRELFSDRDMAVAVRQGVVDQLLGAKAQPATVRLVDYVVAAGRARDFVGSLDWLVEQTARARGWRVARVRAGQDLDEQEREQLSETLGRLAGAPVDLQVTVDPSLLAGVKVEIGDLQIDGTARGRLDRLREHIVTGMWTDRGFGGVGRSNQGLESPAGPPAEAGPGAQDGEGAH